MYVAASRWRPGRGDDVDLRRPCLPEGPGRGRDGGAGSDHVVDEQHPPAVHRPGHGEQRAHPAGGRVAPGLGRARPPPEQRTARETEPGRYGRASSRAWSNPRPRRRAGVVGAHVTTSTSAVTSAAIPRARNGSDDRALRYFSRATSSRPAPS